MQRRRNPNTPTVLSVRSMVETDLEALRQKSVVPQVQRLRESHHWVCYLLATGMSQTEVAAKTGYTVSRISVLYNTPVVQEQIATYRREILQPKIASDVAELRAACNHKLYRQMHDHLSSADDADVLMPWGQICSGLKTINGNSGATVNINVGFAARLEAAIAASRPHTSVHPHSTEKELT